MHAWVLRKLGLSGHYSGDDSSNRMYRWFRSVFHKPYPINTWVDVLPPPNCNHWRNNKPLSVVKLDWVQPNLKVMPGFLYHLSDGSVRHEQWVVKSLPSSVQTMNAGLYEEDFKWIKVKRWEHNPVLTTEDNYRALLKHHKAETEFLIKEIKRLKREDTDGQMTRAIKSYWLKVSCILQSEYKLDMATAQEAIENYRTALALVDVEEVDCLHAGVDETSKDIITGEYHKEQSNNMKRPKLDELLSGITEQNVHDPVEFGPPVGKEVI